MTLLANTSDSVPPPRPIRFVNNQGQPPSKRRRINAACLTCRRRKTRCAGERPLCSTCTKNGHKCLGYPEEGKKEGSDGQAVATDGDEREGQDDYNDENDGRKQRKLAAAPAKESAGQVSMQPARETGEAAPTKTEAKSKKNVHDLLGPVPAPRYSQHPPPSRSFATHDSPVSPAPVRRTEAHRIPYFRYFGPTAIVPGYKQMVVSVRDRRRSTGGSGAPTSPLSVHSGAIASSSVTGSDVVPEDLPVYDLNDPAPVHPLIFSLVKTFFMQMGSNYPFLKEDKFLRLVKEKRVEPILVDAVCSLAARFSDAQLLTNGNDKMPRTERGNAFAQRAKHATVDTFPCPSVGAVQACLLMAYEGFGANQDSALWMYLGLAIRMAVDLGLQKEVGVQYQGEKDPWYVRHRGHTGETESPEEIRDGNAALSLQEQHEVVQERIDTFWAVFILDRVISSGTGRPVTFREDDFELAFPEPFIDPATNWPDPFPIFLSIIHLYGRVCDVLNKIRDVSDLTKDKWDKLGDMEHQLTRMYKSWDSRLQFNVSNFKAYLGIGQGTTFILLHFWFHALFIILHQPTLLTPFGELRTELQLLSDSRELSMSSAKTICDILSFADLIDPKSFIGNPFTSQPIYIAGCAFLMESSATASETPSRTGSPPKQPQPDVPKQSKEKGREKRSSRHSLLASAANQNYQRCYNSLQQIHIYWGGVKYILTALDQKSKGIWDCETYTLEEYESTKTGRRESRSHFPHFENPASPKVAGPPIAWSLAGTANSPNSSLTLMYQNHHHPGGTSSGTTHNTGPRQPGEPPGNMVYDPIRQSLPESGSMFPPSYPQPLSSAVRNSPRPSLQRRQSSLSSAGSSSRPVVKFDPVTEDDNMKIFAAPAYTPSSQQPNGFANYVASPSSNSVPDGTPSSAEAMTSSSAIAQDPSSMFYQGVPFQVQWNNPMGHLESITFDSQDIDISSLGLQQTELMGPWLDYIPQDVLGLFESSDMNQDAQ